MTDIVDKNTRSKMMSSIKSKNTKPEMVIRSKLHRLGYRYKLHDKTLPGKPDMVLPKFNAIILVNGCFWHGHDCHLFRLPKSRTAFWKKKIGDNIKRDKNNITEYVNSGWRVLIIWECAIKGIGDEKIDLLIRKCEKWLISGGRIKNLKKH